MDTNACVRCRRDSVKTYARGLCSTCYRRHRNEHAPRKPMRAFTGRERDIIRRDWGIRSRHLIAAELGRPYESVYSAAVRFGVQVEQRQVRMHGLIKAKMVRLHGQGYSDREIARECGCVHTTVRRYLQTRNLPPNGRPHCNGRHSQRSRDLIRLRVLNRIKMCGDVEALPFLRKNVEGRRAAVRMGWPDAETLLEAKILETLHRHQVEHSIPAMTVPHLAQWVTGCNQSWIGVVSSRLARRGLVARRGKLGHCWLYGLAKPKAAMAGIEVAS